MLIKPLKARISFSKGGNAGVLVYSHEFISPHHQLGSINGPKSSAKPPEQQEIKTSFFPSLLRHIHADRKTRIHCISGILVGGILKVA